MSLSGRNPMDRPAESSVAWTVLAHVLRPQGRKGEVLAELLTDFPARFDDRDQMYLAPEGFTGDAISARPIKVISHWLPVGRNQGRIVLGLEGIDSIEKAETLARLDVIVPDTSRVELAEDEAYIDDLTGCIVFDGETAVGHVTGVDFPTTPDGSRRLEGAAPLLTVITADGDEVLIPYVQSFLNDPAALGSDLQQRTIRMKLPAGLVELNRS